mgnify:CR=1 FL=1
MAFPVQNIRDACEKKGITLAELERKLGIGNGVIASWEKAKRNQLLSEPTPTPPTDPAVMQKISLSDRNIRERYYELTRQERQMLWRNMVESIVVRENVVDITWRQG